MELFSIHRLAYNHPPSPLASSYWDESGEGSVEASTRHKPPLPPLPSLWLGFSTLTSQPMIQQRQVVGILALGLHRGQPRQPTHSVKTSVQPETDSAPFSLEISPPPPPECPVQFYNAYGFEIHPQSHQWTNLTVSNPSSNGRKCPATSNGGKDRASPQWWCIPR